MPPLVRVRVMFCGQGMTTTVEVYDDGVAKAKADYLALIDCGGSTSQSGAGTKVAEKIIASNKKLNLFLISHQDGDHHRILSAVTRAVKGKGCTIDIAFVSGAQWRESSKKSVENFLVAMGRSKTSVWFDGPFYTNYINYFSWAPDYVGYLSNHGTACYIRLLCANLAISSSDDIIKNGSSAVAVVDNGIARVVLPGDATYQTMAKVNEILKDKPEGVIKPVAVLEVPHHGALRTAVENYVSGRDPSRFGYAIVDAFATRLAAKKIVASAGPFNSDHHPMYELLERFHAGLGTMDAHSYVAYSYAEKKGERSEGWANHTGVVQALETTVRSVRLPEPKTKKGNYEAGDIVIDLPQAVGEEVRITFEPVGMISVEGEGDDEEIVFAPAPEGA